MNTKKRSSLILLPLALFLVGCQPSGSTTATTDSANAANISSADAAARPIIEAAPTINGEGGYQFVANDDFKITVRAGETREAELFYQPVTAGDRAVKLKTLTAPAEAATESFAADLKIPEDFNGEVWARALNTRAAT